MTPFDDVAFYMTGDVDEVSQKNPKPRTPEQPDYKPVLVFYN